MKKFVSLFLIAILIFDMFYVSSADVLTDNLEDFSYIPYIINKDLAKRAAYYSMFAYDDYKLDEYGNPYVAENKDPAGPEILRSKLMDQNFSKKDIEVINYKENEINENNVSFVIAQKQVLYFGEPRTLVVLIIRGTNGIQWKGNMDITYDRYGLEDTHTSFQHAADNVELELANYLKGNSSTNKLLLVTGHSRGAAVANIVAHDINRRTDSSLYTEMGISKLFAYTFATPNVTKNNVTQCIGDSNIFNFCFDDDFVPQVPLKSWGYDKYGKTFTAVAGNLYRDLRFKFDVDYFVNNSKKQPHSNAEFNYSGTLSLMSYVGNIWPNTKSYYCDYYTVKDPLEHKITLYNFFRDYIAPAANDQLIEGVEVLAKVQDNKFGEIAKFFVGGSGTGIYNKPDYSISLKHYIDDTHQMFTYYTALNYDGFGVNYPTQSMSLNIKSENGTVIRSSTRNLYYDGEFVTLTAIPDKGYVFAGWSGDGYSSIDQTTYVEMNSNKSVTANFVKTDIDISGPLTIINEHEDNSIENIQYIPIHSMVIGKISETFDIDKMAQIFDTDWYRFYLPYDGDVSISLSSDDSLHASLGIVRCKDYSTPYIGNDIPIYRGLYSYNDKVTKEYALKKGSYDICVRPQDGNASTGDYNFLIDYKDSVFPSNEINSDNQIKIRQIEGGVYNNFMITGDGTLWGWGDNSFGQLSNAVQNDKTDGITKIMEGVKKVSARHHTLVLKNDNSLWGFGYNNDYEITDVNNRYVSTPVKIMDGVKDIDTGWISSFAIKTDGSLWGWGSNGGGELGDGTTICKRSPVKILDEVKKVSSGGGQTLAIKEDGSLWAWGSNGYGCIGDGTTDTMRLLPVKIMEDVIDISAGSNHSLAIKSDGSLWEWGESDGSLWEWSATNSVTYNKIPQKIMDDVKCVSAKGYYTLAVKNDGSLWSWGNSGNSSLGDWPNPSRSTPMKVIDSGVISTSAGILGGSLIIKDDGSLWGWGFYGTYGINGLFNAESISMPIKILNGTSTPLETEVVTPTTAIHSDNQIKIGDYIQLGKYNDEPILWRCVDIDEQGPLMLSDKIICLKAFDATGPHPNDYNGTRLEKGSNNWESSNIRCWLNSSANAGNIIWTCGNPPTSDKVDDNTAFKNLFYYSDEKGFLSESNFSVSEQKYIKSVFQKSILDENDKSLADGGTNSAAFACPNASEVRNYDSAYFQYVSDKIFLIDAIQLNKVYNNRSILGDDYYIGRLTNKLYEQYKMAGYIPENLTYNYLLRTPLTTYNNPNSYIMVSDYNNNVGGGYPSWSYGIRPAFYLDEKSGSLKSGDGTESNPYLLIGSENPSAATKIVTPTPINTAKPFASATSTATPNEIETPVPTDTTPTSKSTISEIATPTHTDTSSPTATATPTATNLYTTASTATPTVTKETATQTTKLSTPINTPTPTNMSTSTPTKTPKPVKEKIGFLDIPLNNKVVSGLSEVKGWFYDKYGVAKIEVLVDSNVVGQANYGMLRKDVIAVYPDYGANCGFTYNLDTTSLQSGIHSIAIRETGNDGKVTVLPIKSITINHTPTRGYIDHPTNIEVLGGIYNVCGWFLDVAGVSQIEVFVDSQVVGQATYGLSRPDVMKVYPFYYNLNSGYSLKLNVMEFYEGTHTIVVREKSNDGVVTTLPAKTVTFRRKLPTMGCIDCPAANQKVPDIYSVKGWFLDSDGVARLEVIIDSFAIGDATYGSSRADVMKVYSLYNNPNCGYSYSLDTSSLSAGTHTITIRETSKTGVVTTLPVKSFSK